MTLYDFAQWAIVIAIVAFAIIWIIKRAKNKSKGCGCGCDSCALKDNCIPKSQSHKKC